MLEANTELRYSEDESRSMLYKFFTGWHMDIDKKGIITTVVGGLILTGIPAIFPWFREYALHLLTWFWEQLVWLFSFISRSYLIPGWTIIVIGCLALPSIYQILKCFRKQPASAHASYVEDRFYGIVWRWSWHNMTPIDLWCYCPQCDLSLSYDDSSCGSFYAEKQGTAFICEHCGHRTVAFIQGGRKNYALNVVTREIDRVVRTKIIKDLDKA